MKRSLVLLACQILFIPTAIAQSFFCVAELSAGFKWKDSKWISTTFTTEDDRYVIRPIDNGDESESFGVFRMGNEYPIHKCRNSTGSTEKLHLVCGGLGYGFIFNQEHLRFQDYYGIGYVSGQDGSANTPSLTAGRCSRIE